MGWGRAVGRVFEKKKKKKGKKKNLHNPLLPKTKYPGIEDNVNAIIPFVKTLIKRQARVAEDKKTNKQKKKHSRSENTPPPSPSPNKIKWSVPSCVNIFNVFRLRPLAWIFICLFSVFIYLFIYLYYSLEWKWA